MFSSLGAFFPSGMQGLDGLLHLGSDSSSSHEVIMFFSPKALPGLAAAVPQQMHE